MEHDMKIRKAEPRDLPQILSIYNQGIEDRIATLETVTKDLAYMEQWYESREERYPAIVCEVHGAVIAWASINCYNKREAYRGVGELSIYVDREQRGKGIGKRLLQELERLGKAHDFYKFVLFTFAFNPLGQSLYRNSGYREVGVFENQGILDGEFVDVMAMEKMLK